METLKISKFLGKKTSNITKKFLSSEEIKSRKKNIFIKNVIKNKKFIISKIKHKKELLQLQKILDNFKKLK